MNVKYLTIGPNENDGEGIALMGTKPAKYSTLTRKFIGFRT